MIEARWNGALIASSDDTVVVEGNHYFPPDSLNREYFTSTSTHTACSWKGTADYFSITVGGTTNDDAAWTYPQPKPAAKDIAGYVAFWRGVTVSDE